MDSTCAVLCDGINSLCKAFATASKIEVKKPRNKYKMQLVKEYEWLWSSKCMRLVCLCLCLYSVSLTMVELCFWLLECWTDWWKCVLLHVLCFEHYWRQPNLMNCTEWIKRCSDCTQWYQQTNKQYFNSFSLLWVRINGYEVFCILYFVFCVYM